MIGRGYLPIGEAFLLAFALLFQTLAYGYEVETHSMISENAVARSNNLTNSFANLELLSQNDPLTADGLSCNNIATQTVLNWIKEGSICEDDTITESFARYKHHFYDPQHNGKGFGGILIRNSGIMSGMPAPDWALDMGPADGQLYSFSQGRQYFYDALTKPSDAERKANLARMFRTLGNVMHIVQDMAQPQHTRNDSHGVGSWYEGYTDQKRKENSLVYGGATVTAFSTAREYFTTLAQFSNNDFVSAGTNFDEAANYGYNLPAQGAATDVPVHTLPGISPEILTECNANKPCVMTFYSTNQTVLNPRASTLSILDQYLKLRKVSYTDPVTSNVYFKNRIFSLNRFTFDSAHPFLIPRATAYSAGILDYFFRGNIDMVADANNPGKYVIRNNGSEAMMGNFALYYDATDGNRHLIPNGVWSNMTIAAGGQVNNLSVMWPDNPAPQIPGEFTLVFDGTMGSEQAGYSSIGNANGSRGAVAAKKVKLSCRTLSIVLLADMVSYRYTQVVNPPPVNSYGLQGVSITNTLHLSVNGTDVETYSGTFIYSFAEQPIVSMIFTFENWPGGPNVYAGNFSYLGIYPATGFYTTGSWFQSGGSSVVTTAIPGYGMAASAASHAAGGAQTVIRLSDGTQLASIPYTLLDSSAHKANYPINTVWSGNNWLDLYTDTNDGNGNWTPVFSQRVTFNVPQGVCTP